jgi:hypothetical protein
MPDLVLLDLSMPGRDGMDVLKEVKRDRPKIPVLVLTMHSEDQFALRALKAGAAGYLTKESAPTELVGAIRKVAGGGHYLSTGLAEKLASHLGPDSEKAGARAPLRSRVPDSPHDCRGPIDARDLRQPVAQRQDRGHLPRSHLREDGLKTPAELAACVVRNRLSD